MNFLSDLKPLLDVSDRLNNLFESDIKKFGNLETIAKRAGITRTEIDISEDDKNYFIEAYIPGLNKDDINLNVSGDGVLNISYERKFHEKKKERRYLSSKIGYGRYHESIVIPKEVDFGQIKADYKNGCLEIVVPKKETNHENIHKIEIGV